MRRQGFKEIVIKGNPTGCYAVDMRNPVTLFTDMDTVLKEPFTQNKALDQALYQAHIRMQESLTRMFPRTLVLSFDSAIMHQKLI